MSIPTNSSILIKGASIPALVLASYLAQKGINVLVIDENSQLDQEDKILSLEDYATDFLTEIGFKPTEKMNVKGFFMQAKEILLKNLCTISWGTRVDNNSSGGFRLIDSTGNRYPHHTLYFTNAEELAVTPNLNLSIKNIALLAWKIEGFLHGQIGKSIFHEHKKEKQLLIDYATTKSGFFDKLLGRNKKAFHLRESKLSLHLSQQRKIEAGDLLPNLLVFDERLKQETMFYNWFKFGDFHLLILGSISQQHLFNVAKWIKSNFPLRLFYLPHSEKNEQIFDFFNVIEGEKKLILIRPDRYIGLLLDHLDLEVLENYLINILQLQTKGKPISQKLIGSNIIENYP